MRFIRPEYIFRPAQILRRLAWGLGMTKKAGSAMAPWGLTLRFDPGELHGRAMLTLGLSDLRVNEMIARIVRKGDIAVDIGANIGIMASLMAARSGPSGLVHALAASKIDYLIFEEMRKTPSPATRALARYGYDCYLIDRSLWGPILYDVNGKPNTLVGEATNILACARDRDTDFLRGPGWFCLKQAG